MVGRLKPAVRRLVVTGVVLWMAGGVTYGILRLTFGARPVFVHVRWAPGTDASTQRVLEQRYSLTQPEQREGRTYGYTLIDVSRDNIRALVGDAAVEDTHYIHRLAFRPWRFAPRRPYPVSYPRVPASLEVLTLLLALAGAAAFGLAYLEAVAPAVIRGPLSALRQTFLEPRTTLDGAARRVTAWVGARIPSASAEAVALFRIIFGTALLAIVLRRPVRGEWAAHPSNVISDVHRLALQMFAQSPSLADWIGPWVILWGTLFIAGAMARLAFAMTAAGVFAWALLHTTETTYHSVAALLITLLCLLPTRWGDAWGIDARRRATKPGNPVNAPSRGRSRKYGYSVWVPGLVMGLTFAAAAVAKLRDAGLAWILNGTVKYHFLSDSSQAMVDWGLDLARYHWVAVVLSFGAIAFESLVIVGVFSRKYAHRLLAGTAALCLLSGFALLQGIIWPGWWILLLSFLPWHLVGHTADDVQQHRTQAWRNLLQPAGVMIVLTLIAAQIVISAFRLEVSPLISTFDMYSTTYGSPEEYLQKAGASYWIVATDGEARRHECRLTQREAEAIAKEKSGQPAALPELPGRCVQETAGATGIEVEVRKPRVDWARWRPEAPTRISLRSFGVNQ